MFNQFLQTILENNQLRVLFWLLIGDLISLLAFSIFSKKLDLEEALGFYQTRLVPALLGYVAMLALAQADVNNTWHLADAANAAWLVLIGLLLVDAYSHLEKVGIPVPKSISKQNVMRIDDAVRLLKASSPLRPGKDIVLPSVSTDAKEKPDSRRAPV
ncbi:MAG: hypothetical protein M1343_08400 [Chloroflexi bacterium]|nr:hypothetical protein [Chloroflexota bacterium]